MVASKKEEVQGPSLPMPEKLWRVADVAAFLNVGRDIVYEMVRRGEMPCDRIGNRLRFHPEVIARWVEDRQKPQPQIA